MSDEREVSRKTVVGGAFAVRDQPPVHYGLQEVVQPDPGAWMVHLPTGIGVACVDEPSFEQNVEACARALRARLAEGAS